MKKPRSDAPSTISGAAMFRNRVWSTTPRPRKRYFTRAKASSVPMIAATTVVASASLIEVKKASPSPGIPFQF